MREARWLTLALAMCVAACATNPTPQMAPAPAASSDAVEVRKALEQAGQQIAAHQQRPPADTPKVDVEAAASMAIPDHPSIRGALAYFTAELKADIQDSLLRSAHYRKLIDRVLDEFKLPKGLAYLPVIESAYLQTLTSRAGAHGMWQFMPETAREYGLRVDWWIDERADPDLSTRAAAAYLTDLYRDFQDWPLALAAYNAGPRRIHRALDHTGSNKFWDLLEQAAIPRETRGYVPTFFAALIIAGDPATYGFRLDDPVESEVRRVEMDGPLSLRFLSEAANVDEAVLQDLNPSLRRGILPPGKTTVRLPPKAAEAIVARAATLKNEDANVRVCTYTVRDGDTLKRLARAIGTNAQTILAMNGVTHLRRGESIYLPVPARDLGNLLAGRRKPLSAALVRLSGVRLELENAKTGN
jgi:membrane-bound lytic murein transglycosylase D